MSSYPEEQYIHALEQDNKKKDAMIDWLCARLQTLCDSETMTNCASCRLNLKCHNNNWRKSAEEAVK